MTSKGEKLFYLLSIFCVITGLMGAATYVFYLSKGGQLADGTVMPKQQMILGLLSYLVFRTSPGIAGYIGCKRRNSAYVKAGIVLSLIAIIMSIGFQKLLPGVGTGFIVAGIYAIISIRYHRALTREEREASRRFLQSADDGPRLVG